MPTSDFLSLTEVLREFRERRHLSARALSLRAGLSAAYVGKLEAGVIEPSIHSFAAIAIALELSSHEVLFCIRCAFAEFRMEKGAQEGVVIFPETAVVDPSLSHP